MMQLDTVCLSTRRADPRSSGTPLQQGPASMTSASHFPQSVVFTTHPCAAGSRRCAERALAAPARRYFDGAATALRIMSSSESFAGPEPPLGTTAAAAAFGATGAGRRTADA